MQRQFSIQEIKASYTEEKKAGDGPWTRYVLRPISFFFAKLFFSMGISPNTVSYSSAVISIIGFFFLAFGSPAAVYLGFFLFFLFGVLDCADGNMARTLGGGSPYGEWVDAVSGYVAYAAFFLGIGAAEGSRFWLLSASAALAGNLLLRLAFQSYRAAKQAASEAREETKGERKFSESIGITGFLVPLSCFAYIFNFLWLIIALYTAVYCGGFFIMIIKLIIRLNKDMRS
ncbi:CDP-alcohol phosphatidyltransferase family protein [Treponema sp. OttesenSCG-928-L16]|nr:CDP-alcohol phosphatidyltransferase family protein [Treponema sp. OttesenSCG-928-L16]